MIEHTTQYVVTHVCSEDGVPYSITSTVYNSKEDADASFRIYSAPIGNDIVNHSISHEPAELEESTPAWPILDRPFKVSIIKSEGKVVYTILSEAYTPTITGGIDYA